MWFRLQQIDLELLLSQNSLMFLSVIAPTAGKFVQNVLTFLHMTGCDT